MQNENGRRIKGIETEYGFLLPKNKSLDEELEELRRAAPNFIGNGSRIYVDVAQLEHCTPENKSVLKLVVYEKAGEQLCQKLLNSEDEVFLVKNNIDKDFSGKRGGRNIHTFGCHENYFVDDDKERIYSCILPFLVARLPMIGAGNLDEDGNLRLSQRAGFMNFHISDCTMAHRGIINTSRIYEPLADCKGKFRFHLICADSNMCEISSALKLGATDLILDLIRDGIFPDIKYESNEAVSDLRRISSQTSDWKMEGLKTGSKYVVDFLNLLEERARGAYYGNDPETDIILDLWKDVNRGLASIRADLYCLVGKLDWVTKEFLLDEFSRSDGLGLRDYKVQSNDIQYHRIDKESLFYQAQKAGLIKRIVTDEEIREALVNPPFDTRANFRGNAIKLFQFFQKKFGRNGLQMSVDWNVVRLFEINDCKKPIWERYLPKPYENYGEYFREFSEFISRKYS